MNTLLIGYLSHNRISDEITISWDNGALLELTSGFALNGRGMELSELTTFDGRLLSFDDRTGMVCPNNYKYYINIYQIYQIDLIVGL